MELVKQIDTLKQEFSSEKHQLNVLIKENQDLKRDLARVNKSLMSVAKQNDKPAAHIHDNEPTQKSQARTEVLEMMTQMQKDYQDQMEKKI